MSVESQTATALRNPDRFFIDGSWVTPSTSSVIEVIEPSTEEVFMRVADASSDDMSHAIGAARRAFDEGPWPRLSHAERADYMRAIASAMRERMADFASFWAHQSGVVHSIAELIVPGTANVFDYYANLAADFPFEEEVETTKDGPIPGGNYGLMVRHPVGVVGAIIPWNGPLPLTVYKLAPALLAGCTVVLKASPEAPGEALVMAEVIEKVGLPPGVVNVLTAGREVSEQLVTDPRVDKIAFTGSSATGKRIAALCADRLARFTLELGGKSAALVLDDADIATAAANLAASECFITGQACLSLTRIVVTGGRHDEFVDALTSNFSQVRVGDPFDPQTQMGPLAMRRQLERVEGYVAKGVAEGARLVTGGGRPKHLERGWYFEPTVFANVDNRSTIAQEEIFGPVLSVIDAVDDDDAVRIANDTIFGLNASVFTPDVDRARAVGGRLLSGTVGHNALRAEVNGDGTFGGFKQSGVGREGGREGLLPYLETTMMILDEAPSASK
jgi:aldehyde dehydrogenase (NAD+)